MSRTIIVALALLASCTDGGQDVGASFKCAAIFECDGVRMDVAPAYVCAIGDGGAMRTYQDAVNDATEDRICTDRAMSLKCVADGMTCHL